MTCPTNHNRTTCYRAYVEFVYQFLIFDMLDWQDRKVSVYWTKKQTGPTIMVKYDEEIIGELLVADSFHNDPEKMGSVLFNFFLKLKNRISTIEGCHQ